MAFRWQKTARLMKPNKFFSTAAVESEYTATPEYPPILDLSKKEVMKRTRQDRDEKLKDVKTVEEKQIKLNMLKYWGFKTYMMLEDHIPYNNLTLAQHVTRTHLSINQDLPKYYENIGVNSSISEGLKEELFEALLLEVDGYRKSYDLRKQDLEANEIDNIIGSCIVRQLNRVITNNLCRSYVHLKDVQIDLDPRIESSWSCGGMDNPRLRSKPETEDETPESRIKYAKNRLMTYIGNPYLTMRSKQPLPFIISEEEGTNPALEVPFWNYDPRVVLIAIDYRRVANIPGFWPGDQYRFGTVQYLKRGHHLNRSFGDPEDDAEALHRQGILGSFGWLSAQANLLGFNTFNDITYPMVAQTIITNGQLFSFYAYQMNTMLLHSENIVENPKRNVCWATPELKLYEKITDGKLEGFNEDILAKLVKFYANTPCQRLGVNLTPYLSPDEKVAADYEDEDKRKWLEREYKFITSNRPRHQLFDEIYSWERIYKVEHKTRPMDKRSRPFELRQNPAKRRYDERKPEYIPRKLRPDLPKNKGRDAKEYFP
ncbi:28S ribosomal protein S30, mitochondrial [Coccinella septempunctata]|uniref:28S ribosomal protein S30, mitochondrial n=1 Tax=Coccinella septempunctata TaxID=41139 RepID=UPI001D0913F3|nr:28S ribosomal protein S30, mitochondrial [Coccinella septempunctata]